MKTITYITTNPYKFEVTQKAISGTGIKLVQQSLETPEIQSTDVREVAPYSANWASKQLKKPVVVTDSGYYFEGLNGFPGPFIKYVNKWFTAQDYLNLMVGKKNRMVTVKSCLAYCEPGEVPITFVGQTTGTIAFKAEKGDGLISPIHEVFIPEGFDKVEAQIPREEMIPFWAKMENYWEKLAMYLNQKENQK